jgi:hypothetical protein
MPSPRGEHVVAKPVFPGSQEWQGPADIIQRVEARDGEKDAYGDQRMNQAAGSQ